MNTLPGYVLPADAPDPLIDIDALSRVAAPDDDLPVVVTRRYLRQVERELRAGRCLALGVHRQHAFDTAIGVMVTPRETVQ